MGDVRIRATNDAGMTLPELLVVMAIVAVLIAVALPLFFHQQAKAYDSAVQSDLDGAPRFSPELLGEVPQVAWVG